MTVFYVLSILETFFEIKVFLYSIKTIAFQTPLRTVYSTLDGKDKIFLPVGVNSHSPKHMQKEKSLFAQKMRII